MTISYLRKQRRPDTSRADAPRVEVTTDQRTALGALLASVIREQRARRDVDDARDDNAQALRKNRAVPWREFFRALDQLEAAARRVADAFHVK